MTSPKVMRANLGGIGALPKDTNKSPLQTAIQLRRKNKANVLTDSKEVPFIKPIAPNFNNKDITE